MNKSKSKKKKNKHHLQKDLVNNNQSIKEEDFDKADKILKAMLKVPPPKKWKK